jgi:hypothetical protein
MDLIKARALSNVKKKARRNEVRVSCDSLCMKVLSTQGQSDSVPADSSYAKHNPSGLEQ